MTDDLAMNEVPPTYIINEDVDYVIYSIAIIGYNFDLSLVDNWVSKTKKSLYLIDPEDNKLYQLVDNNGKRYFMDTNLTVSLEQKSTDDLPADNNDTLDNYLKEFNIKNDN